MKDWKVKLGWLLNALELIPRVTVFTPVDNPGVGAECSKRLLGIPFTSHILAQKQALDYRTQV